MIKYEAKFGPVARVFTSRHIKGWQIWCYSDVSDPYPVALCTNRTAAGIIAGSLQHSVDNNVSVTLPNIMDQFQ